MAATIQLVGAGLVKFHLDTIAVDKERYAAIPPIVVDYDIHYNANIKNRYLVTLRLAGKGSLRSDATQDSCAIIDAIVCGEFDAPVELDKDSQIGLVKGNGTFILYGIARGQVMIITGGHPFGSIVLPTMDWKEALDLADKKKQEITEKKE